MASEAHVPTCERCGKPAASKEPGQGWRCFACETPAGRPWSGEVVVVGPGRTARYLLVVKGSLTADPLAGCESREVADTIAAALNGPGCNCRAVVEEEAERVERAMAGGSLSDVGQHVYSVMLSRLGNLARHLPARRAPQGCGCRALVEARATELREQADAETILLSLAHDRRFAASIVENLATRLPAPATARLHEPVRLNFRVTADGLLAVTEAQLALSDVIIAELRQQNAALLAALAAKSWWRRIWARRRVTPTLNRGPLR